jgi:hypothetical protein
LRRRPEKFDVTNRRFFLMMKEKRPIVAAAMNAC